MNVSFTKKQEKYIASLVQSGDYQNASEAVRDAIRLHQKYRDMVLRDLRTEIEKGFEGPSSKRSVQDIIASKSKTPKMPRLDSYQLSIAADQDLEETFDYTAQKFGPNQAVEYLQELEGIFLLLLNNPKIGKERIEIKPGLGSTPKDSHVIFYRIAVDHIRIVRILHRSRDLPNFLGEK